MKRAASNPPTSGREKRRNEKVRNRTRHITLLPSKRDLENRLAGPVSASLPEAGKAGIARHFGYAM